MLKWTSGSLCFDNDKDDDDDDDYYYYYYDYDYAPSTIHSIC